jgi:multiple sugar transport system permease protein
MRMTMVADTTAAPDRMRRKALSDRAFAWVLIAPAILFIAVIVAWPLVETIRLSFTNASLAGEEYVGFANYQKLFEGGKFSEIIVRTFVWMFFSVSLKLILGLIGASLLMAVVPGQALFRILIMPPWVIPIAMGCLGWLWLFNGDFGIISGVAQTIGITDGPFAFLAYRNSAFWSAIVTDAWVDGAGRWYRFRRITIPQIMPVIVSMALMSAIWTFNSFEIIWILTQGGPRGGTTTMIIDTYKTAIANLQFGEGAARAVIIVIMLALFSLLYLWVLGKVNRKYGVK